VRIRGFLFLFVIYLVGGSLLLSAPWVKASLVEPWTRLNATGAAALARSIGIDALAEGTQVSYGPGSLSILVGCNGAEAALILVSALLAFPAAWPRRLLGVLAGTIAILGANVVRLTNLIAVAKLFPSWLDVFHVYIWQALIVLIAFALFLVWETFVARAHLT
jgi:exosortase H (IPTLxxWG-CTERM-specific)